MLSAYLDDTLSPPRRRAVERLIERDASARQALDELAALRAGLRAAPEPPIRLDLLDQALRHVRQRAFAEAHATGELPRQQRLQRALGALSLGLTVWSLLLLAQTVWQPARADAELSRLRSLAAAQATQLGGVDGSNLAVLSAPLEAHDARP